MTSAISRGRWLLIIAGLVLVACDGVEPSSDRSADRAFDSSTTSPESEVSTLTSVPATIPPVLNGLGQVTGDPFAQCIRPPGGTDEEPGRCVGNPRFEWERAVTYGGAESIGYLKKGAVLSDRDKGTLVIGYELPAECGIVEMAVSEDETTVIVQLKYFVLDPDERPNCESGSKKWALRRSLRAPLGDREVVFGIADPLDPLKWLVGDWTLVTAVNNGVAYQSAASVSMTLTESTVTGVASCNTFSGTYLAEDGTLTWIEVGRTDALCGDWTDEWMFYDVGNGTLNLQIAGDFFSLSSSRYRFEFARASVDTGS